MKLIGKIGLALMFANTLLVAVHFSIAYFSPQKYIVVHPIDNWGEATFELIVTYVSVILGIVAIIMVREK